MRNRLAALMKAEGISAAKLAEITQVQPSTISHIMAGRNNPNFDFLVKLFERFPDVSPDWFLRGAGTMFRSENSASRINLFSGIEKAIENQTVSESDETPVLRRNQSREPMMTDRPPNGPGDVRQVADERNHVEGTRKIVSQIIVFYSDGTYTVFHENS